MDALVAEAAEQLSALEAAWLALYSPPLHGQSECSARIRLQTLLSAFILVPVIAAACAVGAPISEEV